MKRKLASIAVIGLIAVIVAWAGMGLVAVYKAHRARSEAVQFLKDFMQLHVGKSTLGEVEPLVRRYHGEWSPFGPFPPACCGPGSKMAAFVFDNGWERWFFFVPRTVFVASAALNNKGVCERTISLSAYPLTKYPFGVSVRELYQAEPPTTLHARLNPSKTIITLTARASPAQRTAAYSVNLDCLTKLRGCRDAMEMLPAIWKNARAVAPTYWKSQWEDSGAEPK